MNNPSLESYYNAIYEFLCFSKESRVFFADVSSLSIISGNFSFWRHSTWRSKLNQEFLLTWWRMFWQSLAVMSHFLLIYDFQHKSFSNHISCWPAGGPAHPLLYLITNLQIAINCCIIAVGALRERILNVYTVLSILFFSIDVCIRQCKYLRAKHLCIHNLLTLAISLCHCCSFINLILFLLTTSTCYKE